MIAISSSSRSQRPAFKASSDPANDLGPFPEPQHVAVVEDTADVGDHIDDVVAALEPTLQDIVVQHYFQGLSVDDLAASQRLSLGEVFSLLDLALFTIAHQLEQLGLEADRDDVVDALRLQAVSVPRRLERTILRRLRRDERSHWTQAWQCLQTFIKDLRLSAGN